MKVTRFSRFQRIFHLLLIVSFLTQAATGVARMYIETPWGQMVASVFGGYQQCLRIHSFTGFLMVGGFGVYIIYLITRINPRRIVESILHPDTILPKPDDLKDFINHVRWFLGMSKAPAFNRYGYWEKFDFWAVFWGIPVLGLTGFLLISPTLTSLFIPGWTLNIIIWIHRLEAILAMGHIFIIHFFIGHLRKHSFPMDMAMFEGTVDLEKTRHEKERWIKRLETSGELSSLAPPQSRRVFRFLAFIFGYVAIGTGIFLLIGGIINSANITW